MAVNKRKTLDAARKYAQKGAKEKALKEYHTLLKLDPRDAKLHLEIGDAYRRWGQIDEAITEYNRVADQYRQDGFDARAVAVYKQILNLDPKRYSAYTALAELYQRMGLDAEAIYALQMAADGHHKEGNKREALELLRRMAGIDPTNTTSRLKVAELLRQEGLHDDAVTEYEAVAGELSRTGALESLIEVRERILEIQPERVDVIDAVARHWIELRKPENAERFARRALELAPAEPAQYELLCDVYKALGRNEDLNQTTRDLAKLYRERGDEDRAREIMQRIPEAEPLAQGPEGPALEAGEEESLLSEDELLGGDGFLDASGEFEVVHADESGSSGAQEASGRGEAGSAAQATAGDPEQLLAEANVYLRYGKRDQAIASLEAILAQEPGHARALEKLAEVRGEGSDASAVERDEEAAAPDSEPATDEASLDVEVVGEASAPDLEPSEEAETTAVDSVQTDEAESSVSDEAAADALSDVEIEIDVSGEQADAPEQAEAAEAPLDIEVSAEDALAQQDVELPGGEELEIDLGGPEVGEGDAATASSAPPSESAGAGASGSRSSGQSTTSAQQIREELEEAEFYYQQGLRDEAEAIYRRILSMAPNHPSALLRMGEIAAARGEDPGASATEIEVATDEAVQSVESAAADATDEDLEDDLDLSAAFETGDESIAAGAVGEDTTERDAGPEPSSRETDVPELEIGLEGEEPAAEHERDEEGETLPDAVSASPVEVTEPDLHAAEEISASRDEEEDARAVEAEDAGAVEEAAAVASGGSPAAESEASFDLAAELRGVLDDDETPAGESTSSVLSSVDESFESVFADFKRGVSRTLSESDHETRFDLGIAYREMGLLEDAIGEFRVCLEAPGRRLDSLHLMALCALDLGRARDAVNHLEQALATPDLVPEKRTGIGFDLGRAWESAGDPARARSAYAAVAEVDPDFPELAERLRALEDVSADVAEPQAEEPSEIFESFDDLVAEAEASAVPEQQAEVAEAQPEEDPPEPPPAETAEPAGDVSTDTAADSEPDAPPRRKRRISFV